MPKKDKEKKKKVLKDTLGELDEVVTAPGDNEKDIVGKKDQDQPGYGVVENDSYAEPKKEDE